MKQVFLRVCTSLWTSVILMLVYAVLLAAATVIEKYQGPSEARTWIYHAPVFFLIQFMLVVNFFCVVWSRPLFKRRLGLMLVHASFVVILCGAMVTFLFGQDGVLHIREGQKVQSMAVRKGESIHYIKLPFSIELKDFVLTRYPGSSSPSAYESLVKVYEDGSPYEARIYMNNVLDVMGYRIFQASYDTDEQGSVFSVNQDVVGRRISYMGYFMLGVGLLLSLLLPKSRFNRVRSKLRSIHKTVHILWLGLIFPCSLSAQSDADAVTTIQKYKVPEFHADVLSHLPMQAVNGRMIPVHTFSSEILRKLHKDNEIMGLNPVQFVISVWLMPEIWMHVPFIVVPNKELAAELHLPEQFCSYAQLFDKEKHYKLQNYLEEIYRKQPSQRSGTDKEMLKLDERINVFHQLINRQMLTLFPLPEDPSHKWYAPGDDLSAFRGMDSVFVSRIMDWYLQEVAQALGEGSWNKADSVLAMVKTFQQAKATAGVNIHPKRMNMEIRYNEMRVFHHCMSGYLLLGGLSLLFAFGRMFRHGRMYSYFSWISAAAVMLVFLFHIYGMGLRWYLAGYAPWSNSYETMVYVAWATVLSGLCFMHRSKVAFALATLFGGIILFVSELNWMDPQISPLIPVLKSPWLMFHVAVIVGAYGFFGLSCLLGFTNLLLMCVQRTGKETRNLLIRIHELTLINELSLWIGLSLMTAGTFLGAIWANESWGRYWGWDPKETWALITMIVYAVTTHIHMLPLKRGIWWFNWAAVVAFSSVLMTFFGVNYLLSGMHSYGNNPNIGLLWWPLTLVTVVIISISVVSYRKSDVNHIKL